jgi:hypothetical protein
MEPDVAAGLEAAQENSFLARLSLLDPRTTDAQAAHVIADILDEAGIDTPAQGSGVAINTINYLLRQLVYVDPNANMLANGLRPLPSGPRLSLHSSPVTALQFPMYVRGDDDRVVSKSGRLSVGDLGSRRNPFFDSGVLKYYARAGGAAPPTPWSGRKVVAAAVWYVLGERVSAGMCWVCRMRVWACSSACVYASYARLFFRRFDYHPQQYVAGVLEEDDASRGEVYPMGGKATGPGRSFTLYLYDREKHHVREGEASRAAVACDRDPRCGCAGVWVCGSCDLCV